MSVIMTARSSGDRKRFEQFASDNPDRMKSIADQAKEHGLIAHRVYGTDDNQVMVVDEWPDEQSFQTFFEKMQGEIGPMMEDAGLSGDLEIKFWHSVESQDKVGWGA